MKPLLTALGVDYEQWRALTRAAIKIDARIKRQGTGRRKAGSSPILGQVLFYTVIGALMSIAVWTLNNPFVAALIVISYVMIMVGTAMLADHNSVVVSPTDYQILGFQPITSRTYFVAKLTNVLIYTLATSAAVGLMPVVVFFIRHGFAVGVAASIAILACALTVTLGTIAIYAALVQLIGARRLSNIISYVQMVVGFLFYGGYFLITDKISSDFAQSFSLTRSWWLLLYPGSWFASYVELAGGNTGMRDVVPVLATLLLIPILAWQLRGRLSLDYAARLGALASAGSDAETRTSKLKPGLWFRSGEARAVAILVRSQFRNDLRFRMGVLAILPMTVVYLILGVRRSGQSAGGSGLGMVSMAIVLFPYMLKANLARTDAFRGSWIFFASPSDRTRVIRSSKNVLVAFFLIPYLVIVGAALAIFTRDTGYALVYVSFAGLLSHLALQLSFLVDPELPFSKPVDRASSGFRIVLTMVLIGILSSFVPLLSRVLYQNVAVTVVAFAAAIGLSFLLDRFTRARVELQARSMEFEG